MGVSQLVLELYYNEKTLINICINRFWNTGRIIERKKNHPEDLWRFRIEKGNQAGKEFLFSNKEITRPIEEVEE